MRKRVEVTIFALLLIANIIHIIEEVILDAYIIDSIYKGLSNFLLINLGLFIIPLIIFFYVLKKNKIAYYFGIIYGLFMIVDGLDHIVRNYAGIYTSFILIILGAVLMYYLWKELKNMN